jgi:hypothetical protein
MRIRRYISFKPPGIRKKGETAADDIMAECFTEVVRGQQRAILVTKDRHAPQHDTCIPHFRGDDGI